MMHSEQMSRTRRTVRVRSMKGMALVPVLIAMTRYIPSAAASGNKKGTSKSDTNAETKKSPHDPNICSLYLAESSLSTAKEPKWGMYAGIEFDKSEPIGIPEIAIQTFNLAGNSLTKKEATNQEETPSFLTVDYMERYVWVPDATAGQYEDTHGRTVTVIPSYGVLGGFNLPMTNAEWAHYGSHFRRSIDGTASKNIAHVGRGAYSHFYNVTLESTNLILPGSEVFLDYGENYEENAETEEEKEGTLRNTDYDKIDRMVDRIIEFMDKHKNEMTEDAKLDTYRFLIRDVLPAALDKAKGKTAMALLPPSPDGLHEVKKAGGALAYSKPNGFKTITWLEENGRCMDGIKPELSTIPHAGQGAFTTRPVVEGGIIISMPLIQIPDIAFYDMHEIDSDTDEEDDVYRFRTSDEVTGKQLLLNYVFGHPESTMTFLPTGAASLYINHSSEPNAKVVWSDHNLHNPSWYDLAPEKLLKNDQSRIGLMLEVVALRDIDTNEEVFIDYGPEWTKAWEEHVTNWNKKLASGEIKKEWPTRALDLNEEYRSLPFKTQDELEAEPYPDNISLKCFLVIMDDDDDEDEVDATKVIKWAAPIRAPIFDSKHLFDCNVVERIDLDVDENSANKPLMPYNYTIEWNDSGNIGLVQAVPHEVMVFIDNEYTSDSFVKDAFRHPIGFPNDVFPQGPWRNLEK